MHTVQSWLSLNTGLTNQHNQPIHTLELRALMGFLLSQNNAWLYAHPEYKLSPTEVAQIDFWLTELITGKPLAYITGKQNFWDLELAVNSATLIPRPDTECLVETAIELFRNSKPNNILDLGTGSGALALALCRLFPAADVIGVDQSAAALVVAKSNAHSNLIDNVKFIRSNWFSAVPKIKFDLIISNPPYIAPDDTHLTYLTHEPRSALVATQNGLADFIEISQGAGDYLQPNGWLLFEHGWQQKSPVREILASHGFSKLNSAKDLAGNDRISLGQWNT